MLRYATEWMEIILPSWNIKWWKLGRYMYSLRFQVLIVAGSQLTRRRQFGYKPLNLRPWLHLKMCSESTKCFCKKINGWVIWKETATSNFALFSVCATNLRRRRRQHRRWRRRRRQQRPTRCIYNEIYSWCFWRRRDAFNSLQYSLLVSVFAYHPSWVLLQ